MQKEPTPAGASGRTAVTLIGPKQVPILRGERLLFAYPGQSPFARVLVEQLPAKSFPDGKANLVSAFDKLIAGDNTVERNYMLKPEINGFEAHGLDRKAIIGTVLGVYLLIDDAKQTVISIDFLNPPETERTYNSLQDYATLRDAFLTGYSSCVRAKLRANAVIAPAKPKADPVRKTVRKK